MKINYSINKKLELEQSSVYIASMLAGLLPGGALLPQLRNLMELT